MNRILSFALSALLLGAASAEAAYLSPEQALAAARASIAAEPASAMRAPARGLDLALTIGGETPAIYIFTAPEGEPGFMIVSADDSAMPLLGYSDADILDPNNIPPQLQWYLDGFAASIASLAADPESARGNSLAAPALSGRLSMAKAARQPVSPLCSTNWNQDAPYYNLCPLISGQRAYTGCVATAMAQVCKVHNWPDHGAGSRSYTKDWNGYSYTASFDFGNTNFDWSHMLNNYTSSATSAQKTAVAQLMYACGVAANMDYGLDGSGAIDSDAAMGLIQYMRYDKGLSVQMRDYYPLDEWTDLIYSEVAAGRPVLYGGVTASNEGHEIVCDGYSANDFFHFNWGWGGSANGYYLLTNLDSDYQGIGGAASPDGFNYHQSAIIGIQPPVAGSDYHWDMLNESFTVNAATVNRPSGVPVTLSFFNISLVAMPSGTAGFRLVSLDGGDDVTIAAVTFSNLNSYSGYRNRSMTIPSSSIPNGHWLLRPAFAGPDGVWRDMVTEYESTVRDYTLTADDTKIVISGTDEPGEGELSFEYAGYTPADPACYQGNIYTFAYDVTATGAASGSYVCCIIQGNSIMANGAFKDVTFSSAGSQTYTWDVGISTGLAAGDYTVCLVEEREGSLYMVSGTAASITVAEAPDEEQGTISVQAIDTDLVDLPTHDYYVAYKGKTYSMTYKITATGNYSGNLYFLLCTTGGSVVDYEITPVTVADGQTVTQAFSLTIPENIDDGTYILGLACIADGGLQLLQGKYVDVMEDDTNGIDLITAPGAGARYYDLQGRPVDRPLPGHIYITRDGKKIMNAGK